MDELVAWALFLMIPVLLVGGILALVISGLSATPTASLVVRTAGAGLALVLAVYPLLLIPYARGEDSYSEKTRTTSAESRGGSMRAEADQPFRSRLRLPERGSPALHLGGSPSLATVRAFAH
jgi:hypothetical protein